jgi:hypothetical protein
MAALKFVPKFHDVRKTSAITQKGSIYPGSGLKGLLFLFR